MRNCAWWRGSVQVYRLTFVLMLLAMLGQTAWHLYKYWHEVYTASGYGFFSEMLANYQGGFIRRGLYGELLFQIRRAVSYPVIDIVVISYYVSFSLLAALLCHVFKKERLSFFLLPFPAFLYVYLCDPYFCVGKRDCIILLLAYLAFYLYRNYCKRGTAKQLILLNAVLVVTFLVHEAFFFFGTAIILFHSLYRKYLQTGRLTVSLLQALLQWCPALVALIAVFSYSGDQQAVMAIVESWRPYIDMSQAESTYLFSTVGQLTISDVIETIGMSWITPVFCGIPKIVVDFSVALCLYYLISRLNTISLKWGWPVETVDEVQLSNALIMQFLFLLPLGLFFFSDLMRLLPYWSISSIFFYHFFKSTDFAPGFINKASVCLQGLVDRSAFLQNRLVYFLILIFLPVGFMGASVSGILPFIPNEFKHWLMGIPMMVNT